MENEYLDLPGIYKLDGKYYTSQSLLKKFKKLKRDFEIVYIHRMPYESKKEIDFILNEKLKDYIKESNKEIIKVSETAEEVRKYYYVDNEGNYYTSTKPNLEELYPLKEHLNTLIERNIKQTETLYEQIKKANLLNEQEVLNWLDKLNEISVR